MIADPAQSPTSRLSGNWHYPTYGNLTGKFEG